MRTVHVRRTTASITANSASGPVSGIGLRFLKEKDGPCQIVGINPGGGAEQAKLQMNEYIHEVDGQNVHTLTPREVALLIIGPPGTSVALGIADPTSPDPPPQEICKSSAAPEVPESTAKDSSLSLFLSAQMQQQVRECALERD